MLFKQTVDGLCLPVFQYTAASVLFSKLARLLLNILMLKFL